MKTYLNKFFAIFDLQLDCYLLESS